MFGLEFHEVYLIADGTNQAIKFYTDTNNYVYMIDSSTMQKLTVNHEIELYEYGILEFSYDEITDEFCYLDLEEDEKYTSKGQKIKLNNGDCIHAYLFDYGRLWSLLDIIK